MSLTTITTVFPPGGSGTLTIADTTAVAIGALMASMEKQYVVQGLQHTAMLAQLERVRITLADLAVPLNAIKENTEGASQAIDALNSAMGSVKVAIADAAGTQEMMAASVIQANNFQTAVTKQGLIDAGKPVPTMPPVIEQIKTSLKEGFMVHQQAVAGNYLNQKISDTVKSVGTWITEMTVYQTVVGWLKKQKDRLLAVFNFKKPSSIANNAAALSGTPDISNMA
jgi:hypothetical protein